MVSVLAATLSSALPVATWVRSLSRLVSRCWHMVSTAKTRHRAATITPRVTQRRISAGIDNMACIIRYGGYVGYAPKRVGIRVGSDRSAVRWRGRTAKSVPFHHFRALGFRVSSCTASLCRAPGGFVCRGYCLSGLASLYLKLRNHVRALHTRKLTARAFPGDGHSCFEARDLLAEGGVFFLKGHDHSPATSAFSKVRASAAISDALSVPLMIRRAFT